MQRSVATNLGEIVGRLGWSTASDVRRVDASPQLMDVLRALQAERRRAYVALSRLPPRAAGLAMDMYVPLKRVPDEAALANAVLFLASDLSAFVTGTTLHVDGGTWAASGFLDWPEGDGFLPAPMAGTLGKLVD